MKKDKTAIKKRPASGGFSLMEIMIVLVIMSVFLALAGPRVTRGLASLTMKTTAKKVAGSLRYARSQAVNRAKVYSVLFDRAGNRLVVRSVQKPLNAPESLEAEEETADQEQEENLLQRETKQETKVFSLPEGIIFQKLIIGTQEIPEDSEEVAQMTFFPNGTSQGGEITLMDNKERAFIVAVNFLTGFVTIEAKES